MAPLYWWKEFDTYKVGTVANSCSTMHKIVAKEFTLEDFSCEHLFDSANGEDTDCWTYSTEGICEIEPIDILNLTIAMLNKARAWLFEGKPDAAWQTEFEHDASKSKPDEYEAYDAYFYGGNRSYAVVQAFQRAWLLHIHRNPHHWQHWVLINDDPGEGEVLLEMPYNYIIEMICDWWAFSWAEGNLSEIFSWYDEHKDYIKLNPKTRETVEDILWELRGRLGFNVLAHHGVKGQKWGVRNGPPYPLDKSKKSGRIVTKTIKGHAGPTKQDEPDSVVDHISSDGKVKTRAFYDGDGWKVSEIHTSDHGNPKHHSYGSHGEHIHYYEWDRETGKRISSTQEEIPEDLRKENDDIL